MTTNPALADLQFLAGAWDMELSEASFLPDPAATVGGSVTFEWIEQGAALVMRMSDAAAWIIGRDEAEPAFYLADHPCLLVLALRRSDRVALAVPCMA